jgi:quercetin dioxygenase-like cupin family protein
MTVMKTIGLVAVGAALGVGATLGAQTAQSGTRREPQFENANVKVWKSIILPKQPLSMHRHEHGRALIALKGGTIDIVQKTGESEKHLWESGKAYWLDKDLPNTQHADVNNGTEPIEVIVVELQHER